MNPKAPSTVTRQLQTVFAASILLLLLSSAASYFSNRQQTEAAKWVNHSYEVIRNTYKVTNIVREAESGQRGYILTGDDAFLNIYNGAHEQATVSLRELRALTADNPAQQQTLVQLKVLMDERFAQLAHVISKYERQGAGYSPLANAQTDFISGKRTMAELQGLADRLQGEENRLLKLRTDKLDLYNTYTPVLLVVAALVSILISLLAFFRIKADLDARAQQQAEDAALLKETRKRVTAMESVTSRLAGGDFHARSDDTQDDDLGRISAGLNRMAEALGKNFTALNEQTFRQEGVIALAGAVRGERELKKVADKTVQSIAGYLQAAVGTLYLLEGDALHLNGSYAATGAPEWLPSGGGMMGQALKESGPSVLRDLPPDYLTVGSSIGRTRPLHSIILPLHYGGHTIGAMELGMLREPSEAVVQFLRDNAEAIAINLNSAVSYERTQALLEETQAQSEELQMQHTELENVNAELEMQTEKLQASEEELRVQQEELQQTNTELEERSRLLEERNEIITQRNSEVQRQAEELAASTKYKSEFMANMSHELRTPLNSILLLSRLLADNHEETLSGEQVEYARIIQSSGNGLLALIDEILDLSKIEAGKMVLEDEEVLLSEVAGDMESLFQPVAAERGVELLIAIDDSLPDTIVTDKMRLEQVLKNLLSNALKFTRDGSVTLSIASEEAPDHLNFTVTDTGIGIPADKQALIFEAFQQADGSTRRKYGGTGLGLSISRELTRLLGGQITLRSEVGTGSTFTLTIPFTRPATPPPAPEIAAPMQEIAAPQTNAPTPNTPFVSIAIPESIPDDRAAIKAGDKVMLIVEDDTGFAKALRDFTRKRGYKAVVAVRGDEGIALATQLKPAGILLDIELPVKNGWEVMDELKANPATRAIPVHIMSSHSVKRESLMKGAVDFINKPVAFEQMQEVFAKIEHVLSGPARKVLIVEDNSKHASALAYYLSTANVTSDIKKTVPESIEALKQGADCVILDMGIPDATGYAVLEEIKKNPGFENLPIIVFTGKSLSLGEEQRIRQYADSIVVKTAHSYQRVLDEISLFLHIVEGAGTAKTGGNGAKTTPLREVLNGKTVLIVDDDVRNIYSLTKALEPLSMRIITAVDGKEALEQLSANPQTDIVLLDMMMPQMDGYETATRIRENAAWRELPVIAVTAKAMSGDREKCIRAGASDYITKPIDIDQLVSLLRVWLHDRAAG